MPVDEKEFLRTQIDVGVIKEQIVTITTLCGKMDTVIEKLVDQHEKHLAQVYKDMENRRLETDKDVSEVHSRIDTVLDKMQSTELRLMEELKLLRKDMMEHNTKEKESLDKLLEWKWMLAGGILVVSWIISHGTEIVARIFLTK